MCDTSVEQVFNDQGDVEKAHCFKAELAEKAHTCPQKDKLLETTLRNRDTPEFYSYY